jgi:hypothetical protein
MAFYAYYVCDHCGTQHELDEPRPEGPNHAPLGWYISDFQEICDVCKEESAETEDD